eukprot:TRINITY_DN916_c0_g1_i1.p1 TRINITY_DN916_c0_g1~~TRINITY_DN916_c0_g1_i1.p1  ORF type:complete len:150 (-),score=34.37 TRINITY_DN916_c0_g1_i1:116-565(-)
MKTQRCNFSGFRIYPGHGKIFVRGDSKKFIFLDAKCEKTALNKTNPRKVKWTQVYRVVHKKGTLQDAKKSKKTKVVKRQRDIVGASREQIRNKRLQKETLRKRAVARKAASAESKKKGTKKGKKQNRKKPVQKKQTQKAAKIVKGKGRT